MTPKSLLRNERATSRIEDFTQSAFQPVLGPTFIGEAKNVDRVIFCSGKVYYDLIGYLESNQVSDTALVRVEQLYPLDLQGPRGDDRLGTARLQVGLVPGGTQKHGCLDLHRAIAEEPLGTGN